MRILALELSTQSGSAALAEGDKLIAERTWDERAHSGQAVFAFLPALLKEAGWSLEEVDVFAAGRGPGSYSGLRMAVSAVRALALPGGKAVFCVNSGAALAHEVAIAQKTGRVAVCGDARRERAWYGIFRATGGDVEREGEWGLAPADDLDQVLPADALRVSPDWSRLRIPASPRGPWIREDRPPQARYVAELAAQRMARGVTSEPLAPIYVHPPVFVPPKYPG
ncbi:MAG: tRNA (adenosine(37)-N6)-threonylcarbamoyltransferase complex dimerization subunit type 1 TsaB [Kiritimatiellae bacterium]|nr:tRNA (adenosine(37)-N6)-threonylcarbamoyltransferase complex dimerization subunit type 1 TsaB [Kiritimatiellia bacterium]